MSNCYEQLLKTNHLRHHVPPNFNRNHILHMSQLVFSSIVLDGHRFSYTKVVTTFVTTFLVGLKTHLCPEI
jgi:hypothetical protein